MDFLAFLKGRVTYIIPMDKHRYPKNWDAIATQIKEQAGWCCQGCDRPCRQPGETWDELEERLEGTAWAEDIYESVYDDELGSGLIWKPQRFTLTVAHLNHTPEDCRPENLKALCSVCHLRYDARHHAQSAKANKFRKREALGQLTLF